LKRWTIGLLVNPVAGLGGRVALKGSDGAEVQALARARGGVSPAGDRAVTALGAMDAVKDAVELLTCPGEMGETSVKRADWTAEVLQARPAGETTAEDTRAAAKEMVARGAELILFAGGDGTARDIYDAVGSTQPVLGIPAGVKIHSAAFARSAASAGEIVSQLLKGRAKQMADLEVMDIDEAKLREGVVCAKLYGFLRVPTGQGLIQGAKAPSPASDEVQMQAIAQRVVRNLEPGCSYILGPGSTTWRIKQALGIDGTLIGVDVVRDGKLLHRDADEACLLEVSAQGPVRLVLTPIGGQGYLLGRGNQQISPQLLRQIDRERLMVVAVPTKLLSLYAAALLVDTGDDEVDRTLCGYLRVITGYDEESVCPVRSASQV
jgi:predicted polyphosphate/ATP-dependent NAD kinase